MFTAATENVFDCLERLLQGELPEAEKNKLFLDFVSTPDTIDKIVGTVLFLRSHMLPLEITRDAIDTCGSGGSGKNTINTSTIVAFLLSTLGLKVAKHGNRSASGMCGCFDLLEALGVGIENDLEKERILFEKTGLVFLYARMHHPVLGQLAGLRREYGKRTIFNLVGPLCNPAGVRRHILGVSGTETAQLMAQACQKLLKYDERCLVVSGMDGLDEITICDDTVLFDVSSVSITEKLISPLQYGIEQVDEMAIGGGDCEANKVIFEDLLGGRGTEPHQQLVALNAAFALHLARPEIELMEAFEKSMEALKAGHCQKVFTYYKELSIQ